MSFKKVNHFSFKYNLAKYLYSIFGSTTYQCKVKCDLLEESCVAVQNSVKLLSEAGNEAGLRINIKKTKTMIF